MKEYSNDNILLKLKEAVAKRKDRSKGQKVRGPLGNSLLYISYTWGPESNVICIKRIPPGASIERMSWKVRTRGNWKCIWIGKSKLLQTWNVQGCKYICYKLCNLLCKKPKKRRTPLLEMDVLFYPFEKVSMDVSYPYTNTSRGNIYIVSFVDCQMNWVEVYAVRDKTDQTMAKLVVKEMFLREEAVAVLVTNYVEELVNKENKIFGISIILLPRHILPKLMPMIGPIHPTPPLEQDMTQGQFLSGV